MLDDRHNLGKGILHGVRLFVLSVYLSWTTQILSMSGIQFYLLE
jgi:hypothetical protein